MDAETKRAWKELRGVLSQLFIALVYILPLLLSVYYYLIEKDVVRAIFWLLLMELNARIRRASK